MAQSGVNYTYINDGRLSKVAGTSNYWLYYDALGRTVRRILNGVNTYYVYDGEKPVLEYNSAANIVGFNIYGKGVDEIIQRGAFGWDAAWHWYFPQQDHEGSVTHLMSATGTVLEMYRYDAFGAPSIYGPPGNLVTTEYYNNRFLYTGREWAPANLGFYEYRARAYHPTLGRFMSEDPKGFDAGDYNLFRYCGNDPEDHTDAMGLIPGPPNGNNDRYQLEGPGNPNYDEAMRNAQWNARYSGASAIGIGTAGYNAFAVAKAMAASVHDPVINGKSYDASSNYGGLARATGVKAEEQLQANPAAGEYLSYLGKNDGNFIASQPQPQHAGSLVNYSEVYNKRADPSGKKDPLQGTGYRTVAAVVAQKLYTPAGISAHDHREFRKAGLDGWVAVPAPSGHEFIGITVRFHDEHNVSGY